MSLFDQVGSQLNQQEENALKIQRNTNLACPKSGNLYKGESENVCNVETLSGT